MISFKGLVRKVPILGELFFSPWKAHTEAFSENALAVIFSGLPIILPMFAALIVPTFSVNVYLDKLLGEGELFLYASAFVGPLIYAVVKERQVEQLATDPPQKKVSLLFPYAVSFVVISILIICASSVSYALLRLSPVGEHASAEQKANVLTASLITYITAIVCLYCASVYRNKLENAEHAPELMRDDERGFADRWRQRQ